jgi:hypothetical protein
MKNEIMTPEKEGTIIDKVCDSDRLYFEEHPEVSERLRLAVPGEFWPYIYPDDCWVRVIFLAPGVRKRELVL